jgi:DNA-binding NarL/FixJ family response regulator
MIKVLIVDDHAVSRRGLKELLADTRDIKVGGEASNGAEAFQHLEREKWDVVVLDIALPGDNGLDILKRMKQQWPDLTVIAYSAYPEEYYGLRVLEAGAAGYLTKDGPAEELVDALRKVAAGGKYIRPSQAELLAQNVDPNAVRPLHFTLSEREFQVFCLLGSGSSVKQIANKLKLSDKTITTYRERILEKMKMEHNLAIIRYVVENHLEVTLPKPPRSPRSS